ncbi:hypothetical protein [Brachybacterium vulturis]|nr:hypothetical protein [Brachybacterium vulturis]
MAGGLLLLVLLLVLGAFFGMRAYLGADAAAVGDAAGPPAHSQELAPPES